MELPCDSGTAAFQRGRSGRSDALFRRDLRSIAIDVLGGTRPQAPYTILETKRVLDFASLGDVKSVDSPFAFVYCTITFYYFRVGFLCVPRCHRPAVPRKTG